MYRLVPQVLMEATRGVRMDMPRAKQALKTIRQVLSDLLTLRDLGGKVTSGERESPEHWAWRLSQAKYGGERELVRQFFKRNIHPEDVKSAFRDYVEPLDHYFRTKFSFRHVDRYQRAGSKERDELDEMTGLLESLAGALGDSDIDQIGEWVHAASEAGYDLRVALRIPRLPPDLD